MILFCADSLDVRLLVTHHLRWRKSISHCGTAEAGGSERRGCVTVVSLCYGRLQFFVSSTQSLDL